MMGKDREDPEGRRHKHTNGRKGRERPRESESGAGHRQEERKWMVGCN